MSERRAERIRSALFTPGTEPARLRRAATSGADIKIFDLEDAVAAGRETEARGIVRDALLELRGRERLWVRVHAARDRRMVDDFGALPFDCVDGVVLPKVADADEVATCRSAMAAAGAEDVPLLAIIESASGVLNSQAIARAHGVIALALGRFDLAADVGIDPDERTPALSAARALIVLASRAAGLLPAIDSPWLQIADLDGLRTYAANARREGFGGMLLIHPSHVEPVHRVFAPTEAEIGWAGEIVAAAGAQAKDGRGAFARNGEMVDEAVVRRARAILRDAGREGG